MALPTSVFFISVASSAKLVILMFGAAFVWLLAALATSIVWIAIVPLKEDNWFALIFAVLFQEIFRYGYWRLLKRAETGLNILGDDGSGTMSQTKLAMVAGLGFGVMSTAMQINQILEEASGPGTIPAPGCTQHSIFFISSITIAVFGALNILWSVIMHHGLNQGNRINQVIPPATHFFASMLTLNNADGGAVHRHAGPALHAAPRAGCVLVVDARAPHLKPKSVGASAGAHPFSIAV
eukprot:CAMPEP_0206311702 /NCGR_PEP_ID=MMETSP0106_2-20121207/13603_1 /ASSEMBLY_ACC=CAM_ASM_000206 /TAXON_ID=81532 /ORGANISM="Acanthoeca-like sp., Strain 10tr" /LENGTH=237 /DNA_ID=CAMNT_0053742965 /DNA_START=76 /DNA_END=788 /DNA_ORIENTATION=-